MSLLWVKLIRRTPLFLYSLLIIYLSHQPHIGLPLGMGDKTIHFWEYAVYALLCLLFYWEYKRKYQYSLITSTLFGLSDELHQSFIINRHCELADMVINLLGIISALSIFYLSRKAVLHCNSLTKHNS